MSLTNGKSYPNAISSTDTTSLTSKMPKKMPQWAMDEDIVISGISGRFPESDSVEEFANNLYNNIDMVVEDERRWPFNFMGLPRGSGKMKDVSRFDAQFFGIDERESNLMDSTIRIMMELAYEAIWDAGVDPNSLKGTNTGTFIGCCFDEIPSAHAEDHSRVTGYKQTHAQRLAYLFDLKGPSALYDTACASSFCALHEAIVALRSNQCDRAIVAGINLSLRATTQLQFYRLNMISPDGHCKCLDSTANGYAKGEACVVLVLQRKSEAKRIYATVLHTKTNTDGFKELGITYPSWSTQCKLIKESYEELGLDPLQVDYVEAHCTGTQAGDPVEMRAITNSMCDGRTKPLLIGAIKSTIGHTEASSGLCSLTKAILSFENKCIPANLHFTAPNPDIEGLMTGILKPVIQNTPFEGKYIGLNCFGFGGVNVHVIIKSNEKELNDESYKISDKIPRLVQMCGRNNETLQYFFDYLHENPKKLTREFLSLINDISKTSPFNNARYQGMCYRGFSIFDGSEGSNPLISNVIDKKQQIWFMFTGMGCQWPAMAKSLMSVDVIAKSIASSAKVLANFGIDLIKLLIDESESNKLSSPLFSFISIASVQIALVDFLFELGITPDGIIGHSIGEVTSAYADGCLNAEETILTAYWRGKCIEDGNLPPGQMAAVGLSWDEAVERCPNGVVAACHNADDSVTISGEKSRVKDFVRQLLDDNIFAREVDSSGIAFHSPSLNSIGNDLKKALENVIIKKRVRSSKWISSSFRQSQWNDDTAKYASAEYFVHNLLSTVLFHDAISHIPKDAIVIEIAPHHLLQAIVKRNLGSDVTYVPLMKKNNNQSNVKMLLSSIGKLYTLGHNPMIEKLYPSVEYPIPRGSSSISPLIKWDHSKKWMVTQYPDYFNPMGQTDCFVKVDLNDAEDAYLSGHCIDDRVLFPATGYLMLVWEQFAKQNGVSYKQFPIEFENVTLHRATILPKTGITKFKVRILETNGSFDIIESGSVTVTGRVRIPQFPINKFDYLLKEEMKNEFFGQNDLILKSKDIYKEFRIRGYDYGNTFQGIINTSFDDTKTKAKLKWNGNWICFADALIQMAIIGKKTRGLYLPVRIESLRCDPRIMFAEESDTEIEAIFNNHLNIGISKGIEFRGLKANLAPRKQNAQIPITEKYHFVPYNENREIENQEINYLKSYTDACNLMIEKISKKLNSKLPLKNGINYSENEILKKFISDDASFEFFKILKSIYDTETSNGVIETVKTVMSNNGHKLANDLLCETFLEESFLRPQLDIVIENFGKNIINMLEVNASSVIMGKVITELIDTSAFNKQVNYSLLHPKPNDLSELQINSQIYEWIMTKSKLPSDVVNLDLVVYRDTSTCWSTCGITEKTDVNLFNLFEALYSRINNGGFVLILCRDCVTSAEKFLFNIANIYHVSDRKEQIINEAIRAGFTLIGIKSNSISSNGILLRKVTDDIQLSKQIFIEIDDCNSWINKLKEELVKEQSKSEGEYIWLIGKYGFSGVIGLVNCLRQESGGHRIRCLFNYNESNGHKFDYILDNHDPMFNSILKKNLVMNVYRNGEFGTFRHFTIKSSSNLVMTEHAYLNVMTRGDLSSLRWFQAQHKYWPLGRKSNQVLCHVYYAPLNFRDIMLATGKLPPDALPGDMALQDCILGLEFSGRDENGNRVMGMVPSKGLATTVVVEDEDFVWPIPSHWTMEEACTIPVAYATAYYALIVRGKLQNGETVLIHSGSGGVGHAAIAICLSMECHVFTTVGSNEKRQFLKSEFPKLNDKNFMSSRDLNFESHILRETDGRGVDIVLNSLAEDKLQASLRCLSQSGRFLEIGKFDLSQNHSLNLSHLLRNKVFHGILLDCLFQYGPKTPPIILRQKQMVTKLIEDGIRNGVVRPLKRSIFGKDKVEDAFRFMANGKHMGKVIIKVRDEENLEEAIPCSTEVSAFPRTVFYSEKSYIITGGIGGFGLELAHWMVERGANNLVLTSRTGPKEPYQFYRIKRLKDMGARVIISTKDASTMGETKKLIEEAKSLGPIGGIFNLAMVLCDAIFENQTPDDFEKVCAPKAKAAINLDTVSRELCPEMDYFVVFSSVSCGRGNAGQSNYGFANSVMERVCELRRAHGYHGLAIQWGAIGDVGIVSENMGGNEAVIGGTLPQRIHSCLAVFDQFLQSPHSVCSSIVKADKKIESSGKKGNLIKTVAHILGVKDYSSLGPNVTLGELGMDSLMGVEVKQTLERDYELVMSMQEIRKLSIIQLGEISSGNMTLAKVIPNNDIPEKEVTNNDIIKNQIFSSSKFELPTETIRKLNDIKSGDPIFLLPPIDGSFEILESIAKNLDRPVMALNWTKECINFKTIEESSSYYMHLIKQIASKEHYDLIGYSFGGVLSFEIGIQLQKVSEKLRRIILLDSSPVQFMFDTQEAVLKYNLQDNKSRNIEALLSFLMQFVAFDYQNVKNQLQNIPECERSLKIAEIYSENLSNGVSKCDIKTFATAAEVFANKMIMLNSYTPNGHKLDSDVLLIRADEHIINGVKEIKHDYAVSDTITGKCDVIVLKGNHTSFITQNYNEIVSIINKYIKS